jgi:P-type Mg2+ transporter
MSKSDHKPDRDWFAIPEQQVFEELQSSGSGLSQSEASERLKTYGLNSFQEHVYIRGFTLFLKQLKSPLILILLAAAGISLFLDQWHDSLIIIVIVAASALIGYRQEFSAQEAIEKLKAKIAQRSNLLRDGRAVTLPSSEIVPGDIVLLSAGSMIPADGRILSSKDLYVNESALTGESYPSEKQAGTVPAGTPVTKCTNAVFAGTSVRSGTAQVLITATGRNTRFGHIALKLALKRPETNFEKGVKHFGFLLTRITFVLVILVFMTNVFVDRTTIESLLFAVALAVGIAPELLPAIIAVTLSKGARRMSEKGVIVRNLNAIENLGSMDVLCTDKTGTLTLDTILLEKATDCSGKENKEVFRLALLNASLETGLRNPLDEAILNHPKSNEFEFSQIKKLDEIPYDFIRKRVTIAASEGEKIRLVTKGAFLQVLEMCDQITSENGIVPIGKEQKKELRRRYRNWGNQGYRVLAVADRIYNKSENNCPESFNKENESGFTFRGFLLFSDTPKPDVHETLRTLHEYGTEIKILTGDNRYITRHLARTLGMNSKSLLTGEDLELMRDEALFNRVNEITLFAELDPIQKERVIRAIRENDKVVGYLGDGINDVNAMREADISLSVNSAVDVAKAAADMVLLEKELSVLNSGIEEGRRTFANTLKYIFTTSSANFGNMISMAVASAFLGFLPLLPKQILLNNFLSDLPALAIATDRVDRDTMNRPQKWDVRFIRNFMILFGLVSTIFDLITFGVLIFLFQAGPDLFRTGWFFVSLLTEIGIIFVIRTHGPMLRSRASRWLVLTSIGTVLFTTVLIYLPAYEITGFVPVNFQLMAVLVIIVLAYIVVAEWLKVRIYRISEARPIPHTAA